MNARYPVFVVGRDGWTNAVSDERGLCCFEQPEIERGKYPSCWDRDGSPFELTWTEGHGVGLRAMSLPAEPSKLIAALMNHAELVGVTIDDDEGDPVALWERIEAGFNEQRPGAVLRRLFRFVKGESQP